MPATRRSLLSLIAGLSIFRPVRAETQAFTLVPALQLGQRLTYALDVEQRRDGVTALRCRMEVQLEVLAKQAQGWCLRWCTTRSDLQEAAVAVRPMLEVLNRLHVGLPIDIALDEDGRVIGLADPARALADMAAVAQAALDALRRADPPDPLLPALQPTLLGLCANATLVEHLLLKEARVLLGAFGHDYRAGEPLEVRTCVPSPLGHGEVPVLGRFTVKQVKPAQACAELGWLMVLDPQAAREVVSREVAALVPQAARPNPWAAQGAAPMGAASLPALDFDDQARFTVDLNHAWPRQVDHVRRIAAGGRERWERIALERLT